MQLERVKEFNSGKGDNMEYKLKQYSYNSDTSNAYMTTLNDAQFVTIKDTISQVKDE
jgi:hypothetical protein